MLLKQILNRTKKKKICYNLIISHLVATQVHIHHGIPHSTVDIKSIINSVLFTNKHIKKRFRPFLKKICRPTESYFYYYAQCKTTEGRGTSPRVGRLPWGHTHEHDEAVLVGGASLVPHHLLVRGAHRAGAAAGAAPLGAQLASVGPAAAQAHAAAETRCEGGNGGTVRSRAGELSSCLLPGETGGDCDSKKFVLFFHVGS